MPEQSALSGDNFDSKKTSLSAREEGCQEGSGCVALKYFMTKGGGRSEIRIPVNATLEDSPAKFGLWIFGDGKEAWVRGELVDAAGTRFLVDFTNGSKGNSPGIGAGPSGRVSETTAEPTLFCWATAGLLFAVSRANPVIHSFTSFNSASVSLSPFGGIFGSSR